MKNDALIRVASFNLKRDYGIPLRRSHLWRERKEAVAQWVSKSGAAIIGVQELLPTMREDISSLLQGYSVLGFGRFQGRKPKEDEHSDIIVNNQQIESRLVRTFWLSKRPEQLSRAYFAFFPRICTVAELYLKDTGQSIRVFNTHLDHICGFARELGIKVILEYMDKFQRQTPLPTVLMGDFNCKPDSRPLALLREAHKKYPNLHLNNIYDQFSPGTISNTLHNFSGKVYPSALPIDYIFVSDEFQILDSQIDTAPVNGRWPSDHYPLTATLRLSPL